MAEFDRQSDDSCWDAADDELADEQLGRVLDMSNMLALRALVNHMQVCLLNGDLEKAKTLIEQAHRFLDQVEDKEPIGRCIDEIRQYAERRQEQEQNQAGAGTSDSAATTDSLYKFLAEDTQSAAAATAAATEPTEDGGIDDFYRRYHHDVAYTANVKGCCSQPAEECRCDDHYSGSVRRRPDTPPSFVDPWKADTGSASHLHTPINPPLSLSLPLSLRRRRRSSAISPKTLRRRS